MPSRAIHIGFACLSAIGSAMAQAPLSAGHGADGPAPSFDAKGVGAIPRGVVASMTQDRAGFLWVATGDGLVRYDGYRFRPVERDDPDPAKRNLGWVQAMLPARDGRVWIGTETRGLVVYDPASEGITPVDTGEVPGNPASTIIALAEDRDGSLWIGTTGSGVTHLSPASGRVTHHRHTAQAGSLPDDRVRALLVDREGSLWVGTWRGLSRRTRDSGRFEAVEAVEPGASGQAGVAAGQRTVQALFQASDGRIWVGTQRGDLGLADPGTGRLQVLSRGAVAQRGAVTGFVEAPGGRIWVGHATGIDLHDAQTGDFIRRLQHDPRRSAGLAGNEVTSLLKDRAGAIWVGGFGLGLQRHNPNNQAIWMRDKAPAEHPAGAVDPFDVRALLQLDNGDIWAATYPAGVAVMDARLRVTAVVEPAQRVEAGRAGDGLMLPWMVSAMVQAQDGSVWTAGDSTLQQYSRERRRLRAVDHPGGRTNALLADRTGGLWICTQDGLYRLATGSGRVTPIRQADGRRLAGEVFMVAEAPDASLWVGATSGLYRIEAGGDTVSPVESDAGAGLGNPTVIGLLIDSRKDLWIDTAVTGLHRLTAWDGRRARFERISTRHGVHNRPFGVNLLEDDRRRIWTHMYVYDPARDRLDELTAADGVIFGTGWFRSRTRLADGRLLFGGSRGLLVVEPERFDIADYTPPLVVSDLRVNGQSQRAGALTGGLQVAPGQRSFGVEFAALDYNEPDRSRYAYQLTGFDPDWVHTGSELRVASYSNLNPGDYVLRVRAANRSGQWSPNELAIPVRVLPAWWQAWWVKLAGLLMLTSALFIASQWRTRRLRAARQALELTVRSRTADLEEMAQALRRESAALAESSLTDPLTGLRNRRFLAQHIDADIALTVRRYESATPAEVASLSEADLIFFVVDIDHFKEVNDRYGHAAGDAVICQMRERLQRVFRDSDYLVRWGGEEFLVVARGTHRGHAEGLAERARAAVADQPFALDDGTHLTQTCSLGFCCFPLSSRYPSALGWSDTVNLADQALYAVKQSGRNGWRGVVGAASTSLQDLRDLSKQPLARATVLGGLTVAQSTPLAAGSDAPGGAREQA